MTELETGLVCPHCESDESLYSIERAEIMYPITIPNVPNRRDALEYTGDDSITLDDGTVFQDSVYCRGCSSELTLSDLIPMPDLEAS